MMEQIQQSAFIKEECIINWDEKDNVHGIGVNDNLELEKIKTEAKFSDQEVPVETDVTGTHENVKLEKIKVEAESPSRNTSLQISDNTKDGSQTKYSLAKLSSTKVVVDLLTRCPKCGDTTENFYDHFSHCNRKNFIHCVYCPFEVNTAKYCDRHARTAQLTRHIRMVHLNKKKHACAKCGHRLKSWSMLFHVKYCGKNTELRCRHCSFKTKYPNCLKRHMKHHHSGDGSVVCPECNKRLTNQGKMERHLIYCKSVPRICCKICPFETKKKSFFRRHVLKSHF